MSFALSRRPERIRRSISAVRVMRRVRAEPALGSGAGVLARQLHHQALAPLLAAASEGGATPLGFHARAKSVRLDAALVAGTVGGLTHLRTPDVKIARG